MNRLRRMGWLLVGLAVLVTCSGCIYWRLFKLRDQLSEFKTHCTFRYDPGPVIGFHKPTIKPGDLAWLVDREPTEVDGDTWIFRFQKRPDALPEQDLEIRLVIEKGRVKELHLPADFNDVITEKVLTEAFDGADIAKVDKGNESTEWVLNRELDIPRLDSIRKIFGTPLESTSTELHHTWIYRYDLEGSPLTEAGDGYGLFVFNREKGAAEVVYNRVGSLRVRVARRPEGTYSVQVKRGDKSL